MKNEFEIKITGRIAEIIYALSLLEEKPPETIIFNLLDSEMTLTGEQDNTIYAAFKKLKNDL